MAYAWEIGKRYLKSRKRNTISVITLVATAGVALGVGALLVVLSITSGFEEEFRKKVLGVNAHVLVLKYGLDFEEYPEKIRAIEASPEVVGAGPFVINEMMLAKGDALRNVLVKGVDPSRAAKVLALPDQLVAGSLKGMRLPGARPPGLREVPGVGEGLSVRGDPQDDVGPLGLSEAGDEKATEELAHEGEGSEAAGLREGESLEAYLRRLDRPNTEVLHAGKAKPEAVGVAGLDTKRVAAKQGAASAEETPARRPAPTNPAAFAGSEPAAFVETPTPEDIARMIAKGDMLWEGDEQNADLDALRSETASSEQAANDAEDDEARARMPGLVVGKTLADDLDLHVGDVVNVISAMASVSSALFAPQDDATTSQRFRVVGVFSAGFQEYDSRLVYMDLYEAQRFVGQGNTVTGVEVTLHDLDAAPAYARKLEDSFGEGPFHTMDWSELNQPLFTALRIQKLMLSLVIATIIFVAAFNVVATLIMVVLEKRREIAILKAIGAKHRTIVGMFAVQGMVVGLMGTAIGLLLGGAVCWYLLVLQFPLDPKVYLIDHLPLRVTPFEFVAATCIALVICGCATLIPSTWAARLPPAEGLRYR